MQNTADIFQIGQFFESTGADDAILEPAVWAFHLALGLRGEGISDIHLQGPHDLPPLRVDLIGLVGEFLPGGIAVMDKAKNA